MAYFLCDAINCLLINGYFGIYKENWMYAEAINMFGV